MIDAHIHYSRSVGPQRLKKVIEEMNLEGIALLWAIPSLSARFTNRSARADKLSSIVAADILPEERYTSISATSSSTSQLTFIIYAPLRILPSISP